MASATLPKVETIQLQLPAHQAKNPMLLTHHGGEGATAGVAGVSATGAQALLLKGNASHAAASDSLWGNLLLSMAYQRDLELQKYAKRLGRTSTLTMLSIVGITGLGLAQSITSLNNVHGSQTLDVMTHSDGDSHVHTEGDSKAPATLGIISSGATLATIGVQALMNRHYGHRIHDRQLVIKGKIEDILGQLKAGEPFATIQAPLAELVGPTATEEFEGLWRAAHPSIDVSEDHTPVGENEIKAGL